MEAADKDARAFKRTDTAVQKLGGGYFQNRSPRLLGNLATGAAGWITLLQNANSKQNGKTGHIATACHSKLVKVPLKKQKHKSSTYHVQEDRQSPGNGSSSDKDYRLHKLGKCSMDPIIVPLQLHGKKLDMEADTGAALSVISETTRVAIFPEETLHPSTLILKTYTDERLKVTGTLKVRVTYGDQKQKQVLVVVYSKKCSQSPRAKLAEVQFPRLE